MIGLFIWFVVEMIELFFFLMVRVVIPVIAAIVVLILQLLGAILKAIGTGIENHNRQRAFRPRPVRSVAVTAPRGERAAHSGSKWYDPATWWKD